jgi:uncharacterized protein YodC (DUF2158 family)
MKPGDQVQLKSGGPIMTIKWIQGEEAYCEWFDKSDVKGHVFNLPQLIPYRED